MNKFHVISTYLVIMTLKIDFFITMTTNYYGNIVADGKLTFFSLGFLDNFHLNCFLFRNTKFAN